jgi:hypothetical protein
MDFVSAHIEGAPLSPDPDAHSPVEESQNLVSQWNSNPLPRIQFATVLVVGLCYSLPQYSILPFINQVNILVRRRNASNVNPNFSLLASWRSLGETSGKLDIMSDYWCALIGFRRTTDLTGTHPGNAVQRLIHINRFTMESTI